jgi:predicted oxidoreductase
LGWGSPKAEAQKVYETYREAGGNFIDTANFYTNGTSEKFLGEFMQGVHAAQEQALARMYGLLQAQAAVVSYVEMYWLISMKSAIMFVCSFLLKRNEPGKGAKVSVH